MFSRIFAVAAIVLTFSAQAHAHAALAPVLGVAGTPKRSDVQRPSTATPCGKTNVAANIDTSTPVAAAADGTFTVTATNFNGGRDGSRQVSLTVDAAGTGKNFVAGQVTTNGDPAPATVGSEQIVASLPAGTKCTGGTAGNLCLASFKTTGGFGNCVVVQQGAAAAGGAATANGAGAANSTGTATGAAKGAGAANNAGAAKGTGAANNAGAAKGAGAANNAGAAKGAGAANNAGAAKGAGAANNAGAAKGAGAANNAGAAKGAGVANNAGAAKGVGAVNNAGAANGTGAANGAGAGNAAGATNAAGSSAKEAIKDKVKGAIAKAVGTRAPRAHRANIDAREDEISEIVKRSILSWVWA